MEVGTIYFSAYLVMDSGEYSYFDTHVNGDLLYTAQADQQQTSSDPGPATCSAVTYATPGIRSFHQTTDFHLHYI